MTPPTILAVYHLERYDYMFLKPSPLRFWDALLANQLVVRADVDSRLGYVSGDELYTSYKYWCGDCNEKSFTKFKFLACLKDVVEQKVPKVDGRQRRVYVLPQVPSTEDPRPPAKRRRCLIETPESET